MCAAIYNGPGNNKTIVYNGGPVRKVVLDPLQQNLCNSSVDATVSGDLVRDVPLLKDLVDERNLALLMITHNLGVVRETSSYVYVMHHGRIVEAATTEALFAHPRQAYTRNLIASVPRLSGGTDFLALAGAEARP